MKRFGVVMRTVWKRGTGKFALIVVGLWILISLVSLVWTPYPITQTDGYNVWSSPSADHWLGTDGTGADIFSWLMAGSLTDLIIVILTVAFAAALGLLLVAAMVSRSSVLANVSVVAVDALISIPTVLIALILAVPLGASVAVIVVACGFGYGLNLARVARPQAMLAARSAYVESAVSNGASGARVFFGHIVPNILPVMTVQLSLSAGTAVLAESGLTYLGVGVPSGTPSWGHSLSTTVRFISVYPVTVLWPGLVVTVAVVALNLLGDALRDAIDPVANPALRRLSDGATTEALSCGKNSASAAVSASSSSSLLTATSSTPVSSPVVSSQSAASSQSTAPIPVASTSATTTTAAPAMAAAPSAATAPSSTVAGATTEVAEETDGAQ